MQNSGCCQQFPFYQFEVSNFEEIIFNIFDNMLQWNKNIFVQVKPLFNKGIAQRNYEKNKIT